MVNPEDLDIGEFFAFQQLGYFQRRESHRTVSAEIHHI